MAGYLTHVMVLIKAEAWLGELITAMERRRQTQSGCLSDIEEALLDLARRSRTLLRVDPAAPQRLPATQIDNGVGTGLAKYALVGAIGMDFPVNGYVLALNHDWVARTMHRGAPRRAYVNARSTTFVLNFIKALQDASLALTPEQQRALRSYALGHLAGVAADVVLQPAINAWAWSSDNSTHLDQYRLGVQLDARAAHGFFQRDDLHRGQSWEDYFLSSSAIEQESEKLTTVFLKAFRDTYGGVRPSEALCALEASQCRAPELTAAFLQDAYANTKNWAIGVGYDQSPWWWYKPILGTLILGGGMAVVGLAWSATSTYNLEKWRAGDGFATERLWYDLLSNANTWASAVYYPYTWLAKFPIGWSGIFGQGTIGATERPAFDAFLSIFKGIYDVLSFVFDRVVGIAGLVDDTSDFYTSVDPFIQQPYIRWPRFGFSTLLELLKTFLVDRGSIEQGEEGDRVSFTLFWPVKVSTFATYLVSVLLVFGVKNARKEDNGDSESTASGWDFVIGMIAPVVFISIAWGTGFFENKVLADITGAPWPDTETGAVERFLPVRTENSQRSFAETDATGLAVSLFTRSNQGVLAASDGREYYVESDSAAPWDTQRQRDDEARTQKHQLSSKGDYQMRQLLDHAAHLAGLLAMAAVNYDTVDARLRDSVTEIFKDWNLDYRTVEEWDGLMKESTGSDMGLLTATARWWDDLRQNQPATDPSVLDRIAQEMAVTGFSGMILADFTHHGGSPQDIVHPLPPEARCGRLTRPGAIVLANLNIDDPLSITTPLPSPLPDRRPMLDALKDNVIAGIDDELELTQFSVQRPTRPTAAGYDLVLKVHGDDARRVRVFEVTLSDPSPLWPRRLGADTGGTHLERHTIPAGGSGEVDFYVEALTLPGDPLLQAPSAPAPFGRDGVTPVAPGRTSGDVWIELLHRDGGADLPNLRDVVLFTIAPWLMFSNVQPTERLYVVYIAGEFGNHPTVADLVDGMTAALGVARVPVRTRPVSGGGSEFVPHQPLPQGAPNEAKGLYIIDGSTYGGDPWIQDEIEIGYCWAPRAWTHMTIHTPRKRGLEDFVHNEIPSEAMGLFNSLNHAWDSINYGGNLEVSPPVGVTTVAIPEGQAGLAIPAHERAPFGKILLGEGLISITDLDVSISGDLDAGGVPSAAVRTEFDTVGVRLIIAEITVVTTGSEWRVTFIGPPSLPEFVIRLESGDLNVYEVDAAGTETLWFNLDTSLTSDLDAGGNPSERVQEACLDHGLQWPVPRITVRSAGSEWLLTFTGRDGRPLMLIRREGGHLRLYEARIAEPAFRTFLDAQAVQPVLTFDTSWLHVGHVDEVAIFIPATGGKGYRLLMSSTQLATDIFLEAEALHTSDPAVHPLTEMFRGKHWVLDDGSEPPAVISVVDLLTSHRDGNDELQAERLTPIENRLKAGLDLSDTDVIRIPVYYDVKDMPLGSIGNGGMTSAHTPHMVNLQVVDRHMMIPRPFGPRMRVADVVSVLTSVGVTGVTTARLTPLVGHWHWARKNDRATDIGATFGVSASAIRSHAHNSGKFTGAGAVRNNWDRIWIPEDNVDLLEACVQVLLEDVGLTVHWIDDWDTYHRNFGEVHCGTNVVRTPPEAEPGYSGPHWWEHYRP